MTIREYILGLKVGERVIETSNSCLYGRCGTVYHSKEGYTCIMWDRVQGDENTGHMGTSVTGGVRRVSEVLNRVDVLNGMDLKHGIKTFTLIVAECGECGRYDLNSGGEVLFKCPICKCDMDKVGTAVIVKPNDNDDF